MKRKRGPKAAYKKGKQKAKLVANDPAPSPTCVNTKDNPDLGGTDEDGQLNSNMDVESPFIELDKPCNASKTAVNIQNNMTGKSKHGRVKVKLKSSRPLESSSTYSEVQPQNDTDTSNPNLMLPSHDLVMENKEDGTHSDGPTSDLQTTTSGKSPKKSGSIKIISSRGLTSSVVMQEKHLMKQNSSVPIVNEKVRVPSDNERAVDSPLSRKFRQLETRSPSHDSRYNENELNAALVVIKKVMKMDAAEPFNVPVDPVALGIPDYFDVIDTPMDFGTICNDLEHGRKYLNSEDVFKDVQFIWDNCYKYNNKGDYVVDLMKRVKKNFLKYWMAAGLYFDTPSAGAVETIHAGDIAQSRQEKPYQKGKVSKHKRKRHGINKHKSDCLCAVCVVRRRRKERDGNSVVVENQMVTGNGNTSQEFKQEECPPVDNPDSEHTSSSLGQSPEQHLNADTEEPGQEEMETPEQQYLKQLEKQGLENETEFRNICDTNAMQADSSQPYQGMENDLLDDMQTDDQSNMQDEVALGDQSEPEKQEETSEMLNQIRLYEDPKRQENHSILQICTSLFPNYHKSVWNGPHSLINRVHVSSAQESPIHAAMALFLKQL